ncbi:CHAD domain protein [compost metagenome]
MDRLSLALNDAGHDRHEIRLLVKRARYSQEAYPTLHPLPPELLQGLKHLQSALGDWHDMHQWCLKAELEPDLAPLVGLWKETERKAYAAAEADIEALAPCLSSFLGRDAFSSEPRIFLASDSRN